MIATAADLDWIVNRIVALCNPHEIFLFGSYAKDEAHDRSDVDLLVVARSRLPRSQRGREVMAVLAAFPCRFDVLFYTPEEMAEARRDPTTFVAMVEPTARALWQSEKQL
jgi:predicted nucleotidyltransferase